MLTSSIISRANLITAIVLIVLAAATWIFGFRIVGKFCLVLIPVNIGISAFRAGGFPFTFGKYSLVRATDPRGFWIAAAICGLIAAGNLWAFVETLSPNAG
ncbi:MAG TPA: hypothetical protein VJM13_02485 [Sphingopyxis sp.]|nr:hypothetical protein [Sphingopyxis sp.]